MTSNRGSGVAAAPGMAENERQERRRKELEFMLPPHTFQWENLKGRATGIKGDTWGDTCHRAGGGQEVTAMESRDLMGQLGADILFSIATVR